MKIGDKLTIEEAALLLDALESKCEQYTNLAYTALEKGNIQGNLLHTSEASAFGRAKWMGEDWLE